MGLGNPGPDYEHTRHNAGFWLVDQWAGFRGLSWRKSWFRPFLWTEHREGDDRLVLVKPLTYMNVSGRVVPFLQKQFGVRVEDVLVVFDQMDLPPGRVRLKPHGSAAGHNGLKSLDAAWGPVYHRLAIGIGRPDPGVSVIDHVLGEPSADDAQAVRDALIRTVQRADALWRQGWEPLLNGLNQRHETPSALPR